MKTKSSRLKITNLWKCKLARMVLGQNLFQWKLRHQMFHHIFIGFIYVSFETRWPTNTKAAVALHLKALKRNLYYTAVVRIHRHPSRQLKYVKQVHSWATAVAAAATESSSKFRAQPQFHRIKNRPVIDWLHSLEIRAILWLSFIEKMLETIFLQTQDLMETLK